MGGGALVISLDFELHWGIRDHKTVDAYRENLLGVRRAVPAMLDLFARRAVAATWATVGFLFAENKKALERHFPSQLPTYTDRKMSPYEAMGEIGDDEASDPFHYAPSLVRLIAKTPRQELATHTFSHFYCLEAGQTAAQFEADLEAAAAIGAPHGNTCESIVFPRNQMNAKYMDVLERRGIRAYRSNGKHWAYRAEAAETPARRIFRLADAYIPIGGARAHACASASDAKEAPVDVPASAFLRPYSPDLAALDGLRLRRLTRAMTTAAEHGQVFHLWWHPHNFGRHLAQSMAFLERILVHFESLRRRHGMESLTMAAAAEGVATGKALRYEQRAISGPMR
jgi:hypothetical protein